MKKKISLERKNNFINRSIVVDVLGGHKITWAVQNPPVCHVLDKM